MPPGGRPSVGLESRRIRREYEWREDQGRFQELEDDYHDESEFPITRRRPPLGDKLQFTGYDLGSGRQQAFPEQFDFAENYHLGEDDQDDDYDDERTRWQSDMRQQEDTLVDSALRRMARARLRGESETPLSREEIDALERRQLIPPVPKAKLQASTVTSKSTGAKTKRKPVGTGSPSGSNSRTKGVKTNDRRTSLPESSGSRESQDDMVPVPVSYYQQPLPGSRLSSSSPRPGSRAGPRAISHTSTRHALMPDAREYRPPSRTSPHDVDYTSRSRASSGGQEYAAPYPYQHPPSGQVAYYPSLSQGSRRIVSGPAATGYSTTRRPVPARISSSSGLSREVVEMSSESGEQSEDSESDEGVALTVHPDASSSGYSVTQSRPGNRARRTRR